MSLQGKDFSSPKVEEWKSYIAESLVHELHVPLDNSRGLPGRA